MRSGGAHHAQRKSNAPGNVIVVDSEKFASTVSAGVHTAHIQEMMDELFAKLVSDIRIDGGRQSDGSSGPSIDQRRRIAKLDTLRHTVERRFRTPAARERWLQAPMSTLSGRSPMDALTDGDIDAVLKVL